MSKLNLEGRVFGKLTVIMDTGKRKFTNIVWGCKCSCGKLVEVQGHCLIQGYTKSCGHLKGVTKKGEREELKKKWELIKKKASKK